MSAAIKYSVTLPDASWTGSLALAHKSMANHAKRNAAAWPGDDIALAIIPIDGLAG